MKVNLIMNKCLILVVVTALSVLSGFAEVEKLKPTTKPEPAYKLKYKELKKSLQVNDKDLTPTEVLEEIALRYAEMFDKAQENFASLDQRVSQLERDSAIIRDELVKTIGRVDKAEKNIAMLTQTVKDQNADLDKLFSWSEKVEDELFNGISLGAIGGLRQEVKNNKQNISDNSSDIKTLSSQLQSQARAINELGFAIRSLR